MGFRPDAFGAWVALAAVLGSGCQEPALARALSDAGGPADAGARSASGPPVWPAAGAPLTTLALARPKPHRRWRIYLDAGHGAPGNLGNKSVTCENEADFTLRVARDVAARLEATGRFRVKLSRRGLEWPRYQARVAAAAAFHADAIVSLHSDARGDAHPWQAAPGLWCLRNDSEPGMGVLMSDEGPPRLVAARERLAGNVAERLREAGFLLYPGDDWMTLYTRDKAPGVFIDRRSPRQRVYVLRKPRIPSIIIETHHALDFEEAARWKEPRTIEVFADALAVGLDAALRPLPKPHSLVTTLPAAGASP